MKEHDLPKCRVPRAEHEERQAYHLLYGASLGESVHFRSFCYSEDVLADKPQGVFVPMANSYGNIPFGAVNTVEDAGSICFAAFYVMQKYDANFNTTFLEWVDEVVQKGYRIWKFSKYPDTFSTPKVDLDEVKAHFEGKVDLSDCKTEEEIFKKLGEPVGVGVSVFLMDNLISCLSGGKVKAVKDTRIHTVTGITNNLKRNFWVPLRVNNVIYHSDPKRTGGHYVTLYGVKDGNAFVWDSSIGDVKLPFDALMEAVVADKGFITAWDISVLGQK